MPVAARWLVILLFLSGKAVTAGTVWQVDQQRSSITFSFVQEGVSFAGNFARFDLELLFNPVELESSHFVAGIDVGSLNTQSNDRDLILRSAEFFDVERWPTAEFSSYAIKNTGDSRYVARARLKIRDTSRLVDFPFIAEISGQQSLVFKGTGNLIIERGDYGLAQGDWSDNTIVGPQVRIEVNIHATAPGVPD